MSPTQRLAHSIEKQFQVDEVVIYGNDGSMYHDASCPCGYRNHCRLNWHSLPDKVQGVLVLHNCDTSKVDCFIDRGSIQ